MFKSYGQTGQDALLNFLLLRNGKVPRAKDYVGFYIDLGCAAPVTRSNSYAFYERGWSGICVDANPDAEAPFRKARPRDLYVSAGLGETAASLPFYIFDNPELNTFDRARAEKENNRFIGEKIVPVRTLTSILDEFLPGNKRIDFCSLDVEMLEMPVLRGLDFDRYRPSCFVIEHIAPIAAAFDWEVTLFMANKGYSLVSHTGHDAFFMSNAGRDGRPA